jgi:hypothetical protein
LTTFSILRDDEIVDFPVALPESVIIDVDKIPEVVEFERSYICLYFAITVVTLYLLTLPFVLMRDNIEKTPSLRKVNSLDLDKFDTIKDREIVSPSLDSKLSRNKSVDPVVIVDEVGNSIAINPDAKLKSSKKRRYRKNRETKITESKDSSTEMTTISE